MRASAKRKLRTRVLLVIGALIISHIIHGAFPHKAENWDSRIIDRLFTLRPKVNHVKEAHQDSIVHVDVNFYFSRPQHARIIRNLAAMNVSAQLIDFILPDMISEQEDQALIEATKKAESVYFGLEFESLGKQSAEGGKSSYTAGRPIPDSAKWQVIVDGSRESILSGIKPSAPYDALISASRGLGFINMTSDSDGIIRRLPLLVQYQDLLYPSLALRVICDYLKVPPQRIIVKPGKSITLKDALAADGAEPRNIIIPIDENANFILNLTESWSNIRHYSYSEIFQASEDETRMNELRQELSGKIAVLSEKAETPYQTRSTGGNQRFLPSGAIHALVLQNILSGSFLRELPQSVIVLIELGLLVIIFFLSLRFSSPMLFVGTSVLAAAYVGLAAGLFFFNGFIFQFVRPLSTLIFASGFLLIGLAIERAFLFAQTERARRIAERELEIGRQIQSGFFPTSLPAPEGWELAIHFQAARHVAGDFYDVFTLGKEKKIGLVIADVCDKGVGAALFMALFRSFIRVLSGTAHSDGHLEISNPIEDPKKILERTILSINNYISITHETAGMFATIFYAILDTKKGTLTYINCGHEPPTVIGPHGIKCSLNPTGPAVGLYPNLEFRTDALVLAPADTLLVYTDGIIDAQNKAGESFTKKKLTALMSNPYHSAEDLIDEIKIRINNHILGATQFDDITILALRRKE